MAETKEEVMVSLPLKFAKELCDVFESLVDDANELWSTKQELNDDYEPEDITAANETLDYYDQLGKKFRELVGEPEK